MSDPILRNLALLLCLGGLSASGAFSAEPADARVLTQSVSLRDWTFPEYGHRIELAVEVPQAGTYRFDIDENTLMRRLNAHEPFRWRSRFFPYNRLFLAELTPRGERPVTGGFHLIVDNEELIPADFRPAGTGHGEGAMETMGRIDPRRGKFLPVEIPRENEFYFFTFENSGGGSSPLMLYEPIHEDGSRLRTHNYGISYQPRLLRQEKTKYEVLLVPDKGVMKLFYDGRFSGKPRNFSLRRATVKMIAKFDSPGRKRLYCYIQMENNVKYLHIPRLRAKTVPPKSLAPKIGRTQRLRSENSGLLAQNGFLALSRLAVEDKVTPDTPQQDNPLPEIEIKSAANARESFQLLINPKRTFVLNKVEFSDLKNADGGSIPAANLTLRRVGFVPVTRNSNTSPWSFHGLVGDILLPDEKGEINVNCGSVPLWGTLFVPSGTPGGVYRGNMTVFTNRAGKITVPLKCTVHDFEFPEYASFKTNLGAQYFAKGARPVSFYHGVRSKADVKKLAETYYREMAKQKIFPKNPALYAEIKFKWQMPPKGMNVEAPENFFRLYDWDFTEYGKTLEKFIDGCKIDTFCIYHTNAVAANIFPQLPLEELAKGELNTASPFVTTGNQAFRKMLLVGYDIGPEHSYRKLAAPITRAQYDRLVTDYLRAIAGYLEKRRWLDRAVILIDESENDEQLTHFLGLLKKDPLLRKIKVQACVQGLRYFTAKKKDGRRLYEGLVDIFSPEMDESYDRTESYYFTDYGIAPDRKKLRPYIAYSSRLALDVPGICTRMAGFDVFRRNGSGLLDWEIALYCNKGKPGGSENPRIEPYSYENGGVAFFYPPTVYAPPQKPDFTLYPSLRLELLREMVDDFEYAVTLEKLAARAKEAGIASRAEEIFADLDRMFSSPVSWSVNHVQLYRLRDRMADEIARLKHKLDAKK